MMPRVLLTLAAVTVIGAATTAWSSYRSKPTRVSTAAATQSAPSATPAASKPRSSVPAHRVAGAGPAVDAGIATYTGAAATVSCATCHATVPQTRENGQAGQLPKTFHAGLHYQHGGQSCLNCHNADNYDTLRLANGSALAFSQAQQLCSQCHGPQTRDYLHGTHGGMTGYWDQRRGPRQRNTCTDCHDPHAPAYPVVQPVFQPRDRSALQQAAREAAAGASFPSHSSKP